MVDLSICIVTYKTREYLRACLDSLRATPHALSYEILIVDNGSEDGTLEMLREQYPEARVTDLGSNEGYTRPMNIALRQGQGKYLLQLNPDTIIQPGTFDTLFAYMESHPECGIVTPKVLNRDGTMQWQCRRSEARPWDVFTYFTRLSQAFPNSPRFAGYLMTYRNPDETHAVQAVSGSCMFIRRALVEQIGYLDERYFAYQEDTDFCLRARRAGWTVIYLPEAKIIHHGAEGGTRVHPYRSAYEWHRSYFQYYSRWFARDYFFLFNWLFYTLMAGKFTLAMLKIFFSREKYPGTKKP
jgi:GT2 family glycosyltransferase